MAAKRDVKKPGRGWLSKTDMAEVLGVTEAMFDRKYRQLAGASDVKGGGSGKGQRIWFRARGVIDAWMEDEKSKLRRDLAPELQRQASKAAADSLIGASPKLLDEIRHEDLRQKRRENDVAEGKLIAVEDLEETLVKGAGVLRGGIERIQRQYGNDASAIMNEAVDEWAASCETVLKDAAAKEGAAQ